MILTVQEIEVEVTYKPIRTIRLKINREDGRVSLSLPYGIKRETAEALITSRLSWIREKRASLSLQFATFPQTGDFLKIGGEEYRLLQKEGTRYAFSVSDKTVILTVLPTATPEAKQTYLKEQYRKILEESIRKKLPVWESKTGLSCREWHTKDMKTRWGTCNTKAGRIWLNVRLAEKPPICLDYVLLHELTHLLYPNHGNEFKAFLTRHMPDWRTVAKLLNDC